MTLIRDHSSYGFEAFLLEKCHVKKIQGRQDPGCRRRRGGGRAGRGGGRLGGLVGGGHLLVDEDDPHVDVVPVGDDVPPTHLGDDHDPLVDGGDLEISKVADHEKPSHVILETSTPASVHQEPTAHDPTTEQPPPLQPTHHVIHRLISSYPTFDLGIIPPSDDATSQSTSLLQAPLSQASDPSNAKKLGGSQHYGAI